MSETVSMQLKEENRAGIEEIQIRESIKAENRVMLMDVEFCNGDKITVSGNDISIIDRFIDAGERLEALVDEMEQKEKEISEKDYRKKIEERKYFSDNAAEIMDGVFGKDTTRKFFGDVYKEIPNFQPDYECFMDFWDALAPVIEKLSNHKVKLEKMASRKRMEKYRPQDHEKPGTKK